MVFSQRIFVRVVHLADPVTDLEIYLYILKVTFI